MLFSSRVRVRIRVKIKLSIWLLSWFAHVFVLLYVVIVALPYSVSKIWHSLFLTLLYDTVKLMATVTDGNVHVYRWGDSDAILFKIVTAAMLEVYLLQQCKLIKLCN